jgi:hypothetical protein
MGDPVIPNRSIKDDERSGIFGFITEDNSE